MPTSKENLGRSGEVSPGDKGNTIQVIMPERIRVEKGQTANLGNYNSARWGFGWETNVRPGETPSDAKERAEVLVEKWNAEEQEKWVKA